MNKKIALSFTTALILAQNIYANDTKKLDTVTVTAQKTEENLQEVPISITVFDEFTLEDRGIDSVADISKYTPGLMIISEGTTAPSVRGLFTNAGSRPVAGLFIDGVPMLRGGYDSTLMDIQRVEVLKGPQGTLYGRNAQVGVINVISKKPNNETKGKIGVKLGSDNLKEYTANVSGAIVKDTFYIGLSGKHYEKDGFITNTYKNKIEDDREHDYGKINLRWTPSDDLELSLISSKIKYNDGGIKFGSTNQNYREINTDFDTFNKSDTILNALNISYTINDKLSLTSTTTYLKENIKGAIDFDYSSNIGFHVFNQPSNKSLSEELKLNYESDNLKLVSGIYIENEKKHSNMDWIMSNGTRNVTNESEADFIGLFSHLTYDINDRLSVLGGLRYDKAEQTFKDSTQTIDNNESEISPKLGVTYDLKENIMTYATISKGYKAGGFNQQAIVGDDKTYDKETLYSYEIGLKGTTMDGRLSYDTAVYYMDITDMQVMLYPSTGGHIIENAAQATSKGIEASLNFQITDTINLFAGVSYNDVKFDQYNNGKADYSSNRATFAPKYDFNLGVTYRAEQGYYASADISGYGDMYGDFANELKIDAYELVNTKLGYEQENYDIYLYANNLFDKKYDAVGLYGIGTVVYSEPREIGVQLAYRF